MGLACMTERIRAESSIGMGRARIKKELGIFGRRQIWKSLTSNTSFHQQRDHNSYPWKESPHHHHHTEQIQICEWGTMGDVYPRQDRLYDKIRLQQDWGVTACQKKIWDSKCIRHNARVRVD